MIDDLRIDRNPDLHSQLLITVNYLDSERTASKFDAEYLRVLLEKAWGEAAFVFTQMMASPI